MAGHRLFSSAQIRVVLHPFTFSVNLLRTLTIFDTTYLNSLFGTLGFGYVQIPAAAMVSAIIAITLAVTNSEPKVVEPRRAFFIFGVLTVSVLAVFGTLYLTISYVAQPTIEGVQGRYFLPVLPVFLLLLIGVTKTRLHVPTPKAYHSVAMSICGLVVFSLVASSIKYLYIVWG